LLQHLGQLHFTERLGLALPGGWSTATTTGRHARPPGMFGHANASAAVASLAVPVVLGLVDEGRLRARWIALPLLVVFGATALTLTRSTAGVSLVLFAFWMFRSRMGVRRRMRGLLIAAGFVGAILLIGPPGGAFRWS